MRASFVLAVLLALAAARGGAAQENADSVLDVLSSSTQLSTLNKYVQKVGRRGLLRRTPPPPLLVAQRTAAPTTATCLSGGAGGTPPSPSCAAGSAELLAAVHALPARHMGLWPALAVGRQACGLHCVTCCYASTLLSQTPPTAVQSPAAKKLLDAAGGFQGTFFAPSNSVSLAISCA